MKKPAKKTTAAKPAKDAAPAKPAKESRKKSPIITPAPVPAPAAPAKKKSLATEPPDTFISAQIDIGFGNHLTIRGEGPGLSWDDGLVMDCTNRNLWTITIKRATRPIVFKVLVNDLNWSVGADYTVAPGQSITVSPSF